ncbi:MAG: D-alanyl-D-alanine carboxypeptidase [Patiriisocius sp.]
MEIGTVERRKFLGLLSISAAAAAALGGSAAWKLHKRPFAPTSVTLSAHSNANLVNPTLTPMPSFANNISAIQEDMSISSADMSAAVRQMAGPAPDRVRYLNAFENPLDVEQRGGVQLARYLNKMSNFERSYDEDIFLTEQQRRLLADSFMRIDRVQSLVGHGNFTVLGFDDMIRYARRYDSVGAFSEAELEFLEQLFFDDVERYGFYGEKVIDSLTAVVNVKGLSKVAHTGHFLFRGESEKTYAKIRKDVGSSLVLTSGIRGIVKQTHLFLAKTIQSEGNLSLASRSLAPPGHSFHGIGDFDVGKVGYGARNFTADFSDTTEFRKLVELDYLDIRYPEQNLLGVRYEPWHIKVV